MIGPRADLKNRPGSFLAQELHRLRAGRLLSALDRQDVRNQLEALGVDPRAAQQRVAALSDEDIRALDGRLGQLPAGGDILGVALVVFLVLLLTDILGYTHIFPFVKKTVH